MNSLTMKQTVAAGLLGAASLAGFANAGFLGFVASVRTVGAYTVIDIYAGVQNSSDKFLNAYNGMISTTVPTGFNQLDGLATKTWKPDFAGFTSSRTSLDSFMTAGTFTGSAYNGNYFASAATAADPNFTGTSWNATPGSAPATTLPTVMLLLASKVVPPELAMASRLLVPWTYKRSSMCMFFLKLHDPSL